jgi:hypothetical protein
VSKTVSIIICTRDRPEYLRQALNSIRRQTAIKSISQILVSENGDGDVSRTVCGEFLDLPVSYIKQDPPVAALRHVPVIWERVNSPISAILHDDDWWGPQHIEKALTTLHSNSSCVGVYAAYCEAYRPEFVSWPNYTKSLVWLASRGDFSCSSFLFDRVGVMLSCILNAGLHYSSLVGRTEEVGNAFSRNATLLNSFDNDRTYPLILSELGDIAYNTDTSVFVRQHPFRHAWSEPHMQLRGAHMLMAAKTTLWLREHYPQLVVDGADRLNQRLKSVSSQERELLLRDVRQCCDGPQLKVLLYECGIDLDQNPEIQASLARYLPSSALHAIAECLPPILYRVIRRLRYGSGWEAEVKRWQKKSQTRSNTSAS